MSWIDWHWMSSGECLQLWLKIIVDRILFCSALFCLMPPTISLSLSLHHPCVWCPQVMFSSFASLSLFFLSLASGEKRDRTSCAGKAIQSLSSRRTQREREEKKFASGIMFFSSKTERDLSMWFEGKESLSYTATFLPSFQAVHFLLIAFVVSKYYVVVLKMMMMMVMMK